MIKTIKNDLRATTLKLFILFLLVFSLPSFAATAPLDAATLAGQATSTTAEMSGINVLRQIFGDVALPPDKTILSFAHLARINFHCS